MGWRYFDKEWRWRLTRFFWKTPPAIWIQFEKHQKNPEKSTEAQLPISERILNILNQGSGMAMKLKGTKISFFRKFTSLPGDGNTTLIFWCWAGLENRTLLKQPLPLLIKWDCSYSLHFWSGCPYPAESLTWKGSLHYCSTHFTCSISKWLVVLLFNKKVSTYPWFFPFPTVIAPAGHWFSVVTLFCSTYQWILSLR